MGNPHADNWESTLCVCVYMGVCACAWVGVQHVSARHHVYSTADCPVINIILQAIYKAHIRDTTRSCNTSPAFETAVNST
jgi:hypothetical protein